MTADPDKKLRRRTVKTRSRFTTLLTVYFFAALIIPNCVLANTEPYSVWTVEALILMPLGFYMMWSVALSRSGGPFQSDRRPACRYARGSCRGFANRRR